MRKQENIENLSNWLAGLTLGIKPSLHINSGYSAAAVVVDLGTPKVPISMTADLNSELCTRMKELAAALTGKRNFRINYDNARGVYWASSL